MCRRTQGQHPAGRIKAKQILLPKLWWRFFWKGPMKSGAGFIEKAKEQESKRGFWGILEWIPILKNESVMKYSFCKCSLSNYLLLWLVLNGISFASFCFCCCLVIKSCPTLWHRTACSPPGSFVQGISQARILEWVGVSFSRGSSRRRGQTCIFCFGRWILYHWTAREAAFLPLSSLRCLGSGSPWFLLRCLGHCHRIWRLLF